MASGAITYEVCTKDPNCPYVEVYLGDGLTSKDVELSFGERDGEANVYVDHPGGDTCLSHFSLPGFRIPAGVQATYNSKRLRYRLRLAVNTPNSTGTWGTATSTSLSLGDVDIEDACEYHDARSSEASEADAQGENGKATTGLTKGQKKTMKKKKKKQKERAALDGQPPKEQSTATPSAKGGVKNPKTSDEASLASQPPVSPCTPPLHAPAPDGFATTATALVLPEASVQLSQRLSSEAPSVTTPRAGASKRVQVNPEEDFAPESDAVTQLSSTKEMVMPPDLLHGPFIKTGMGKSETKGEDKWFELSGNKWELPALEAATAFSAFGVFDGHGGKQSATYATKNLLGQATDLVGRLRMPVPQPVGLPGATEADARVWAVQDAMIERLPKALHTAFVDMDKECQRRFKQSGTTATLAVCVGWELLVASVGDSCAYLDTGTEVIQISANHRVSENADECDRIKALGGSIAQSDVDGVIAGPLRVWPGGLAMTRSLGDAEAGRLVTGEPDIRQITIPAGGARLILASDGLWDAVTAKTIIQKVRRMVPGQAANMAMHTALDKKGLSDDITVLVVDFCAAPGDKMAASLMAGAVKGAHAETSQMWKPLEAPTASWRERLTARRTAALVRLAEQHAAEEAAAAAAAAEAARASAANSFSAQAGKSSVSDMYKELVELRVDLNDLEGLDMTEPDSSTAAPVEDDASEWTTVKPSGSKASEPPAYMQEMARAARAAEGGHGRGGKSGPRGAGRQGRDFTSRQAPHQAAAPAPTAGTAMQHPSDATSQEGFTGVAEGRGRGGRGMRGGRGSKYTGSERQAGGVQPPQHKDDQVESAPSAPEATRNALPSGEVHAARALRQPRNQSTASVAVGVDSGSVDAGVPDAHGGEGNRRRRGRNGNGEAQRPPRDASRGKPAPPAASAAVPPAVADVVPAVSVSQPPREFIYMKRSDIPNYPHPPNPTKGPRKQHNKPNQLNQQPQQETAPPATVSPWNGHPPSASQVSKPGQTMQPAAAQWARGPWQATQPATTSAPHNADPFPLLSVAPVPARSSPPTQRPPGAICSKPFQPPQSAAAVTPPTQPAGVMTSGRKSPPAAAPVPQKPSQSAAAQSFIKRAQPTPAQALSKSGQPAAVQSLSKPAQPAAAQALGKSAQPAAAKDSSKPTSPAAAPGADKPPSKPTQSTAAVNSSKPSQAIQSAPATQLTPVVQSAPAVQSNGHSQPVQASVPSRPDQPTQPAAVSKQSPPVTAPVACPPAAEPAAPPPDVPLEPSMQPTSQPPRSAPMAGRGSSQMNGRGIGGRGGRGTGRSMFDMKSSPYMTSHDFGAGFGKLGML